jgi:hypothetical protein
MAARALAAAAFRALALRTLATTADFFLDIDSVHDVLLDYGGMPWSEG